MRLTNKYKNLLLAIGIFSIFFVFAHNTIMYINKDNTHTIKTTYSLITELNLDLNEFKIEDTETYNLFTIKDKIYNYFPYGTSILISPIILLFDLGGIDVIKSDVPIRKLLAGIFTALSCILIFFTYKKKDPLLPLLITAIYFFCTPIISSAGMDLWSQTTLLPIYAYVILVLHKNLYTKNSYLLSAYGLLYYSFLIRPTSAIPILFLTLYLIIKDKKAFLKTLPIGLSILILSGIYNYIAFDNILYAYFEKRATTNNYPEALLGLLFSPARGLLFLSPFLIFGLLGLKQGFKKTHDKLLTSMLALTIFIHFLTMGIEKLWWGGWSLGPRFFTEMIPFFMYFIFLSFDYILKLKTKAIQFSLILIFIIMTAYSLNVYIPTSYRLGPEVWNSEPKNINLNPERLWDYSDLPHKRGKHKFTLKPE